MAEKKKKSIYSRKLKDVNKDGKKNFADTWLGDLLGADGKAGIKKGRPGLKASLKGARREDGKADTTAKKADKTGRTSRTDYVDTTDEARAKRTRAANNKKTTKKIPARSERENNPPENYKRSPQRSAAENRSRENTKLPAGVVSNFKKRQEEKANLEAKIKNAKSRNTLDRKSEAELKRLGGKVPTSETYTTFFNKNKDRYKKENGGYDHQRAMKDFNKRKSSSNMAKGGMAKKKSGYSVGGSVRPRTGHTDLRKGLFK